ncbi:MAG TPA: aminoglycoside phosphotransferase family protein [Rubrobacteraceae bacterium]|nr:aminoglycoside phosphotransferase family protein [Rubrobacteraceae bacterium]
MSASASAIPVIDPFAITGDEAMPSLAAALEPAEAQRRLSGVLGTSTLREIRVTRYKPERRCVIEYDVEMERHGPPETLTLIGKVRRLRSGKSGYRLLEAFRDAGFGSDAGDGIMVPEPIGVVREFRMWLQRKIPGQVATDLLERPGGEDLVRRIAEAAHKVHQAGVPAKRSHTMSDELRILHERLPEVARARPEWAGRIERLLAACGRLGAATPESEPRGIHRDFYADQILANGDSLYLLDFDLYCAGDPALDVGNFLGHIREQSLRTTGDPDSLAHLETAMEDRFVELSGEEHRAAIHSYTTLTLARHVQLSTLFPERRAFTEAMLELCEERLGARC